MEEHVTPIKGQFPNPHTVACKDCVYRDRTVLELSGEKIYVGVTRDICYKFGHKPPEVLFQNAPCDEYQPE